jgi:hypothetical protein
MNVTAVESSPSATIAYDGNHELPQLEFKSRAVQFINTWACQVWYTSNCCAHRPRQLLQSGHPREIHVQAESRLCRSGAFRQSIGGRRN